MSIVRSPSPCPGEDPSDYRLMTAPERNLAVAMAKRIHKVQGRPEGLVGGAYMIMTGIWTIIFSIAILVFVFVGSNGHNHPISFVFGPVAILAATYMFLRLAQYRRSLRSLRSVVKSNDA
jgi:uncharacterized integral membrane protein